LEFHSSILIATLVGQRVFGDCAWVEDIKDHDELRHDPVMAVLAGKLEARRRPTNWVREIRVRAGLGLG
jgi:hypothetical protein